MNILKQLLLPLAVLLSLARPNPARAQTSNLPPEISIVWPVGACQDGFLFRRFSCLKIKAVAEDPDGSIAEVRFFNADGLLGVVTNAPFEIVWLGPAGTGYLRAVAVDNLGATNQSATVIVVFPDFYNSPPVFAIRSPAKESLFPAPASFAFSAEHLSGPNCQSSPVEFFLGTNFVGVVTHSGPFTASTPLYSLVVTNVPEGDYLLSVQKDGYTWTGSYAPGSCDPVRIHVTKLGMHSPRLTPDSKYAFDVVTSFPTNQHVIEASSNLLSWTPISTNVPFTNTFTFTDPSPATNSPRFYRAVVPSP